jgi:hypothetical protein
MVQRQAARYARMRTCTDLWMHEDVCL